jgi:hypothetical protein
MSNKELFLSHNNLKENFQTVADEILKNTGYNISRHRSLETKFNSMAKIILNKTNQEEQTLLILNTKLQESSVSYFQKAIKKNKGSKQNVELTSITDNQMPDTNINLDNQMNQLINDRKQLNTQGATENYMPRPSNPICQMDIILNNLIWIQIHLILYLLMMKKICHYIKILIHYSNKIIVIQWN